MRRSFWREKKKGSFDLNESKFTKIFNFVFFYNVYFLYFKIFTY